MFNNVPHKGTAVALPSSLSLSAAPQGFEVGQSASGGRGEVRGEAGRGDTGSCAGCEGTG